MLESRLTVDGVIESQVKDSPTIALLILNLIKLPNSTFQFHS